MIQPFYMRCEFFFKENFKFLEISRYKAHTFRNEHYAVELEFYKGRVPNNRHFTRTLALHILS